MSDRFAVAAAGLFAVCSGLGAAVSLREDIPGEPLLIRVPGSVAVHLTIGWGSALSAPWPMPVAALGAAIWARPDWPGQQERCLALEWPVLPVFSSSRRLGAGGRAALQLPPMVPLNLASVAALIWTGRRMIK